MKAEALWHWREGRNQNRAEKHKGKAPNTPMLGDLKWEEPLNPCEFRKADEEGWFSLPHTLQVRFGCLIFSFCVRSTAVLFQVAITINCCSCSILGNTPRRREHELPAIIENNASPSFNRKASAKRHTVNPSTSVEVGESSGHRFTFSSYYFSSFCLISVTEEVRRLQQSSPSRSQVWTIIFFFFLKHFASPQWTQSFRILLNNV